MFEIIKAKIRDDEMIARLEDVVLTTGVVKYVPGINEHGRSWDAYVIQNPTPATGQFGGYKEVGTVEFEGQTFTVCVEHLGVSGKCLEFYAGTPFGE